MSILCNNAGVAGEQHVTRLTYEYWDWVIGINLNGVINGIQTFMLRMIKRGDGGHIVNTASGAGLAASASGLLYTTSKFAVVGLSESLRNSLEPFKIGVSVLCPGPVNTKILSNSRDAQPPTQVTAEEAKIFETAIAQANAFLAAGVDPDEVGEMVLAAVKANRLYIHTDRIMAGLIEAGQKCCSMRCRPRNNNQRPQWQLAIPRAALSRRFQSRAGNVVDMHRIKFWRGTVAG